MVGSWQKVYPDGQRPYPTFRHTPYRKIEKKKKKNTTGPARNYATQKTSNHRGQKITITKIRKYGKADSSELTRGGGWNFLIRLVTCGPRSGRMK